MAGWTVIIGGDFTIVWFPIKKGKHYRTKQMQIFNDFIEVDLPMSRASFTW